MVSATNHAVDELVNQLPSLKTPADKALMARVTRFFVDAIVDLPPADKTVALQARGDILAVIETLARRPAEESAKYLVKLRGAVQKRKILDAEGGVIGPSDVAKLLNITRQAVSQRRAASRLLGVRVAGGFAYPVWQFEDGETIPGLEQILAVLADYDPWMQMVFFLNKSSVLNNRRPLDVLKRGQLAKVIQAAQSYLEQGPA